MVKRRQVHHELPDVAHGLGDRVAGGEEVLSHGILLVHEQLGAADTDELDGDAARLGLLVRFGEGLAVREPDKGREDARLGEYAEARMRRQVRQHLEFGQLRRAA
jgi:hypothetical protein